MDNFLGLQHRESKTTCQEQIREMVGAAFWHQGIKNMNQGESRASMLHIAHAHRLPAYPAAASHRRRGAHPRIDPPRGPNTP